MTMTVPQVELVSVTPSSGRRDRSADLFALQALSDAVAEDDVQGFTSAVADLVGGPVQLIDSVDGVIARAGSLPSFERETRTGAPALLRELALRDGARILGTVELPVHADPRYDGYVRSLGAVLLRTRIALDEQRGLRMRLAFLDCIWPNDEASGLLRSCTSAAWDGAYRPVVVTSDGGLQGTSGRRTLTWLLDSRDREPILTDAHFVLHDGVIVGMVPDAGGATPDTHVAAWQRLVASLHVGGPLHVVIGASSTAGTALREQFRTLLQIARLQGENSRYLRLPHVAAIEQLGPLADVLLASGGRVAPFIERVLGDLLTSNRLDGQLIETLYAYLRAGGSIRDASALLHLHPSSVKYRVRILRGMLGPRLDDQDERFELELATRVYLAAQHCSVGQAS